MMMTTTTTMMTMTTTTTTTMMTRIVNLIAAGPGGERLADQGLIIGNSTGVIKLQETLQNNFFGTQPENGVEKDVKLYYRLNDGSMQALNAIDLKFFYYETMEDVPQILIDENSG